MNEYYAALIVRRDDGYVASLQYGLEEEFLQRSPSFVLENANKVVRYEQESREEACLFYSGDHVKVDDKFLKAKEIEVQPVIYSRFDAHEKCLGLLLADPRMQLNEKQ
ncbi:MAG: hypothetical protein CMH61_02680 [Nanoarchaeota archaeon]|nr:hypothetical protein [Nanoarchaeota archaeon]|tara:strand:+ start:1301 stop:1624 length:324 start_codon:yes stop_codon:yes gene_type:complete